MNMVLPNHDSERSTTYGRVLTRILSRDYHHRNRNPVLGDGGGYLLLLHETYVNVGDDNQQVVTQPAIELMKQVSLALL